MKTIRPPAVAGMFYPAHPKILSRNIDDLLERSSPNPIAGSIVALIVPHAGYTYSGLTAAHAYNLLRNVSVDTVVIVSPSHREYFPGISIYDGEAFRTPLGATQIDEQLRSAIVENDPIIEASQQGHGAEHAIEVQLPFLQQVLKEVKILPIVMGDQHRPFCLHLGEKLANTLKGTSCILVASSDLSHYHPHDEAEQLDRIVTNDVAAFSPEKLMDDLENEHCEACGGGPIVSVMVAAKKLGANHVEILHHCNSGDVTGDRSAVVGYLSAAITQPKADAPRERHTSAPLAQRTS